MVMGGWVVVVVVVESDFSVELWHFFYFHLYFNTFQLPPIPNDGVSVGRINGLNKYIRLFNNHK